MCRGSTGSFFWVSIQQSDGSRPLPTVRTLKGLRALHQMAVTYQCRPSEVLGVTEPFTAYGIDQAVLLAGSIAEPENKMHKLSLKATG
jgi:hypothetical protein